MSKDNPNSGRYFLKIALTAEEKILVWGIFGPGRSVSTRIREVLLDPYARRDPDQWRELITAITRIESLFETLLRAQKPHTTEAIPDFLIACYAAHQLLENLRKHAA